MNRVAADDWRRRGQERYLLGASFKRMAWSTKDPQWDHDHCEFRTRKFALAEIPDSLQEGYATPTLQHWVCPECFEDFREEFGWIERHKS